MPTDHGRLPRQRRSRRHWPRAAIHLDRKVEGSRSRQRYDRSSAGKESTGSRLKATRSQLLASDSRLAATRPSSSWKAAVTGRHGGA
ncbi:hypothetical protein CRG98_030211 [Punica granatum]|uniref:Uncharacterized protein n=1 Tax=Punica granatum TaxID=22663 RepID=A0A2I0IZG7_PUNGR|nr:hypothetical protein CRG98_030211 [Punica granatum]